MRGTGLVCVPVVPLGTLADRLSRQVGMFGVWPMVPWRVGALAQGGCGAQVHHGVLWDGREVAVKVQYLGLETAVTADLACLAGMAAAAARLLPAAPDLRWMVADLRSNLAQELDFRCSACAARGYKSVACVKCLLCSHATVLHVVF